MPTPDAFIIIGKIGTPHGVRGDFKVTTFTQAPENFIAYKKYFIKTKVGWEPIAFEHIHMAGERVMAKILSCDSPEDVRKLYGNREIATLRSELPPLQKNEYYWADLFHLKVINKEGVYLGDVSDITETPGSHDILHLTGERRRAIPYRWKDVIVDINLDTKTIMVDWDAEF